MPSTNEHKICDQVCENQPYPHENCQVFFAITHILETKFISQLQKFMENLLKLTECKYLGGIIKYL